MREDATCIQERTHLNPMSEEDTPQSWSGEDTPRSYVCQEGQLTCLNPIYYSGEDSEHTSILVISVVLIESK